MGAPMPTDVIVWILTVTQLWGNVTGTVSLLAAYPTRESCVADGRYFDDHQPQKRVYAECKAVRLEQPIPMRNLQ
jgi:hypothetical protein